MIQRLRAYDDGTWREVEINVTGLAGFLLAKVAAAHGRRKPKDWYDIAFVLLHNNYGDALAAATRVGEIFGASIGALHTQLLDLRANFEDPFAQGTTAYVDQFTLDHPDVDSTIAGADAQIAVEAFTDQLLG